MKDVLRITALAWAFGGLAVTASAQPACCRCIIGPPDGFGTCVITQTSPGSISCTSQAFGQCQMGATCELTAVQLDASAVVHRESQAMVDSRPATTPKLELVIPRATMAPGSSPRVGCAGIIVQRRMSAEGMAIMRRMARQIRV